MLLWSEDGKCASLRRSIPSSISSIDKSLTHATFSSGQFLFDILDKFFVAATCPGFHKLAVRVQSKHGAELDIEHLACVMLCEVILAPVDFIEMCLSIDPSKFFERRLEELARPAPRESQHHNRILTASMELAECLRSADLVHAT
eukprot:CAMPEP_0172707656 /NCGR_PEP_ID=MMETSP1074-20121228/50101_1 /TAXON_ID=2916 /ORGANISM="Ceratium fusus, Strain PA161109" /LENGTH=144 /DNA_ID=CAMNT_0013530497 /DNA_START=71 /DNA_END=502 /DNA_ORIENTATION=-